MREEPFGPLALVTRTQNIDEAIERANAVPYGLAGYAFTNSSANAERLSQELEVGNLSINHFVASSAAGSSGVQGRRQVQVLGRTVRPDLGRRPRPRRYGARHLPEEGRIVDEGFDFRNYTYARYGHVIKDQPDMMASQIFDKKVLHLLRDEYCIRRVTVSADTLKELLKKLEGVDAEKCLAELKAYNAAVMTEVPFNPAVKDGRGTRGLKVAKSNWANVLDEPPFEAYEVTCGLTFTFGGLKISTGCEVEDTAGQAIPGLHAAGELVGGLFYHNYPGGTGLTSGAVFGEIAGEGVAEFALGERQREELS